MSNIWDKMTFQTKYYAPVNVKPRGGGRARVRILTEVVKIDMGILSDDTEIGVGNFDSIG